jgi:rRNA maturation RNase YbeY
MIQGTSNPIQFHFLSGTIYLPERASLKSYLTGLFRKEGLRVQHINYIFCTDAYLHQFNQQYLKHDTYTDIITFQLSGKGEPLLSDIYISIDRVRDNAKTFNTSFKTEIHRVIFHGALHLCGYKDKSKKEAGLMREREEFHLNRYFVSRGTK